MIWEIVLAGVCFLAVCIVVLNLAEDDCMDEEYNEDYDRDYWE